MPIKETDRERKREKIEVKGQTKVFILVSFLIICGPEKGRLGVTVGIRLFKTCRKILFVEY